MIPSVKTTDIMPRLCFTVNKLNDSRGSDIYLLDALMGVTISYHHINPVRMCGSNTGRGCAFTK